VSYLDAQLDAQNPPKHDEDSCKADAKLVFEGQRLLNTLFNPPDFIADALTRNVCADSKAAELLRNDEEFVSKGFAYRTIWPDEQKLPPQWRGVAEAEIGEPIYADLKVAISFRRDLLKSERHSLVKPVLCFPGGGAVSDLKVLCSAGCWLTLLDHRTCG
jgi:hypothetical protein